MEPPGTSTSRPCRLPFRRRPFKVTKGVASEPEQLFSCALVSPLMATTLARQLQNIAQIVLRRLWRREVTTAP